MCLVYRTYQCPFCKGFPWNIVALSGNNFYGTDEDEMDSDGYDWSGMASNNYVMCPECRNVFDVCTGNDGESTVYESEEDSKEPFRGNYEGWIHKVSFANHD